MQDTSTLIHQEFSSQRTFDVVVAAFEVAIGPGDGKTFQSIVDQATSANTFADRIRAAEGSSGFILFLKVEHSPWLARVGIGGRATVYTIGNPLIAQTMIRHNIEVGLNVPVRLLIYEDAATKTGRIGYDLPSSLMDRLKNEQITAAAKLLDDKLAALARHCTGTSG
ncbi:MAG: DUF302 domain-containing protein [Acidobacteriaceae bacterium]